MTPHYRTPVPYSALERDCLVLLQGRALLWFSGTTRGHPAPVVRVLPGNMEEGWGGPLWNGVVAPLLERLSQAPPAQGWFALDARSYLARELRAALARASVPVDYDR